MLDRLRTATTAQPWRAAALTLGLGLVISLISLVVVSSSGADTAVASSTTTAPTSPEGAESTTTVGPGPSITVDSATTTTSLVEADRPAFLGVRIDNAPGARPQWGLNQADLVIEYPVEGNLTRFTAVFSSNITGITGPVRSLRPVDGKLLSGLIDVLATTGGQSWVLLDVESAGIAVVVAQLSSMFPSVGNPDPHDTFVDLGLLSELGKGQLAPIGGLPPGVVPDGAPAVEIELPYDGVSYTFDSEIGYVRHQEGNPFPVLDLTGSNTEAMSHNTLVVVFAAERPAGYVDSNGVSVSDFDVIGAGQLLVFHEGAVVEGTWSRDARADGFVFRDSSGGVFGLPDGRTYLGVVPRSELVSFN